MFENKERALLPEDEQDAFYDDGVTLTAADIAAELRRRLPDLGVTRLHKLLYYCQGHHIAATKELLFSDNIFAFDLGPVVSRLWKREQDEGPEATTRPLDESALNTVGYVLHRYGALTARDLVNLTHAETPWQRADERRPPGTSVRIETDWMREYFEADADDQGPDGISLDPTEVERWLAGANERRTRPVVWDSPDQLRQRAVAP